MVRRGASVTISVVDPWMVPAVESAGLGFFGLAGASGAGVGAVAGVSGGVEIL